MREEKVKTVITLTVAIFMTLFCMVPFIYMVVTSLSKNSDFLSLQSEFRFTFGNYRNIFTTRTLHFFEYLRNSIIISGVSAIISVLIASLAAYSITRVSLPAKNFILLFTLSMSMFPQICLVGYLFSFMTKLGWINTYPALIFPYIAWILPLSLWILVSYFIQLPKELDKAAIIDGCSTWQVIYRVIFPVARPGLFCATLLAFIFAFNEFMFALMFTTDHTARTIPVGIALFQGLHGEIPWGNIMAASTITTIPIVILVMIFQNNIIQGLTSGALKG